jgi:fatty-acyl-CoA synthase
MTALFKDISSTRKYERTPIEDRVDCSNTYDLFRQAADRFGARLAIRYLPTPDPAEDPVDITFDELFRKITQTANLFSTLGVGPSDTVACLLPNVPEAQYVIWGGQAAGIACSINYYLETEHIVGLLNAARARILVAYSGGDFPIWHKLHEIREKVPTLSALLYVGPPPSDSLGALNFRLAVESCVGERLSSGRSFAKEDIAAYFHTGGTTGVPKLTPVTHWNEVCSAHIHQAFFGFGDHDILLSGMPMFHAGGVKIQGIYTLTVGATNVFLGPAGLRNKNVVRDFWRYVERFKATYFAGPPTFYSALNQVSPAGADISSVRLAKVSSAPCPVEVFRRFKANSGIDLHEAYGLTEAGLAIAGNPPGVPPRPGSAGFAMPYIEQKIVQIDPAGEYRGDCAVNETGVVAVRGPTVFPGYLQAAANEGVWLGAGWMSTGDLGRVDEDGYLWVTGRMKDLIIRGGHNIDPEVVEDAMSRHPAVALCGAVGRPDAYAGELPVAFVTLKIGATATVDELIAHAANFVAERAAVPKEVFILDEMPLTPVGKIDKRALRRRAAQSALEDALAGLSAQPGMLRILSARIEEQQTGLIACIGAAARGNESEARKILDGLIGEFTFPYELEFETLDEPSG